MRLNNMEQHILFDNFNDFLTRIKKYNFDELIQFLEKMKNAVENDDANEIERLTFYLYDSSHTIHSFAREVDTLTAVSSFYGKELTQLKKNE